MIKDILLLILANYPILAALLEVGARVKRENKAALFYTIGAVFMPLDFLFQYTWGVFLFREWPPKGEHTFSARIRRYWRAGDTADAERWALTCYFRVYLNKRLPGHIE